MILDLLPTYEIEAQQQTNRGIVHAVFAARNAQTIPEALSYFQDDAKFHDYALNLNFDTKERLALYFHKIAETFPDGAIQVDEVLESKETSIVTWTFTAVREPSSYPHQRHVRIVLNGVSIATFCSGRIVEWRDYYDALISQRLGLAASFVDWQEY
jgi:ketosteroid isomerase-like protein